MPAMIWELGRD